MTRTLEAYTPRKRSPNIPEEIARCYPDWGPIHQWMWWASETTHAPPQFLLGAILPCLAYLAARRGYRIGPMARPPSLWTCAVGPSGTAKSTALIRAADFLRDHLHATSAADEEHLPFVETEGSLPGIFEALAGLYDPERDATLAILYDEEFTRLIDRREAVAEILQKMADNRPVVRQLRQYQQAKAKGQKVHDRLINPVISAMFATTTKALGSVFSERVYEGGLFSRICWVTGQLVAKDIELEENPRETQRRAVLDAWTQWTLYLDGVDHRRWIETDGDMSAARLIQLPEPVKDALTNELFEPLRAHFDDDGRLNSLVLRALGQAQVVAGLYAMSRGRLTVHLEDVDEATSWLHYLFTSAQSLDGRVAVSRGYQLQQDVLSAIEAAGADGISKSRLYRLRLTKQELDEALGALLDREAIEETKLHATAQGKKRRGRPTLRYRRVVSKTDSTSVDLDASAPS